ncbi:MAG TPA: plasmid pRiA4b ORF-3 family protein, partial [Pseudonocardiaceae bacterium]
MTAKRVLRRADVSSAGQAMGVEVPQRVRSAADVPGLHQPWTAALAIGLLSVSAGRAVPGPALAGWRSAGDDEVLDGWSRGLAAVLADTFDDDGDGSEALEIGRLVLTVLAADPAPAGADLRSTITEAIFASSRPL